MVKQICRKDLSVPHKWFAWYPVNTGEVHTGTHYCHKCIWLEYVMRTVYYGYGGSWNYYSEIPK